MKYWNKDKRTRESHWYKVEISSNNWYGAKIFLQRTPGNNKFFIGRFNVVWFENQKDAVFFSLKWL